MLVSRAQQPSVTAPRAGKRVAALLTLGALSALQAGHVASSQSALPVELAAAVALLPADPYTADLAEALGATSVAVRERAASLAASRAALARTSAGLSVVGELGPTLEFERDLEDPAGTGAWDTDIDVSLTATYRRDSVAITRARLAVANAETRLRDQLRDDLQRALLALSTERLSLRSLDDAVAASTGTESALAAAVQQGVTGADLLALQVEAELAANALERERAAALAATTAAARLGLPSSVPVSSALLQGTEQPLSSVSPSSLVATHFTVPTPEQHSLAKALRLELDLAVAQANAAPFSVVREIEVYGAYENAGFEVAGRAALVTGVPLVSSSVSWTNGDDDVGFVVGVGATLRFTDRTAPDAAAATAAVTAAQVAYAAFLDDQVATETGARLAAELDFEDLTLARLQLMNLEAQLAQARATSAPEREVQRLVTAVRRSQDASERAWQRYVRSLVSYLGVIDAAWRTDVMEER